MDEWGVVKDKREGRRVRLEFKETIGKAIYDVENKRS